MKDKKVLIISNNSFSKTSNNGKTYEAIFSKFRKDNLAQLFFSENEDPDMEYCERYFKVTDQDVLKNLIKFTKSNGNPVIYIKENKNVDSITVNQSLLFNFFKKRADMLIYLRDVLWSFNSWKTPQLKKWLRDFNPDLIFFVAGPMTFPHKITKWIAEFLDIPIVLYFTDDYVIYPKSRNLMDTLVKYRANKIYKKTIKLSISRFTIGELMSYEYEKYFGTQFNSIMNSIEIKSNSQVIELRANENYLISYFGGLHLNRWKMISRLSKIAGDDFTFNVYSMEQPTEEVLIEFKNCNVNFCGGLVGLELEKKILESDVLLHVESDNEYYRSLTKLSVSTKIPEYLISGRMILGFGPEELASMRVLSDNNLGLVISSDLNDDMILEQINILRDISLRNEFGLRAQEYARDKFDKNQNAESFKKYIEKLI